MLQAAGGRARFAFVGAVVLAALLLLAPGSVTANARLLPSPRAAVAECAGSAGDGGAPSGYVGAGPLHVSRRAERSAHYSPAARRYSSKMPAVLVGRRWVTVSVPRRLRDRVRLNYTHSGLATELTMEPCPGRSATFFPGGIVFTRHEPIALNVTVEGSGRRYLLRLGRFRVR